ncbi:MAG: hypothetical protein GX780_00970 [Campylobacteraceae bacterium]|nr:hypothetical protein [Campylobacteraceae bacterium]
MNVMFFALPNGEKISIIDQITQGERMYNNDIGVIKAIKYLPKIEIKNALLLLILQ